MNPIKFSDAAKYFSGQPHQIDAFNYLQSNTPANVVEEFAKRYRTAPPKPRLPELGVALIKEFEGCELSAYPDPLTGGPPVTIGWGSTRNFDGSPFSLGAEITQQQADDLLLHQLKLEFLPPLEKIPFWKEMNDHMKGCLLSFAYNLGANFYGSEGFNTISSCLRGRRWKEVPGALMLYVNPGTNVTEGLKRRRTAEGNLWKIGLSLMS